MFILPLILTVIYAFTTTVNATTVNSSGFPIIYKQINEFEIIWDDKGSGADRDVSIWRPVEYQAGYYPLGDVAVASHSKPMNLATTVYEVTPGSLAPPASFEDAWNDENSGADDDVKIMKMIPQAGFTCLGYIATNLIDVPSVNDYRCVKSSYTIKGKYVSIWNDKGSGPGATDITIFSNNELYTPKALFTNTFTSFNNYHDPPTIGPDMLNSDYTIRIGLIQQAMSDTHAIKVYELPGATEIWNDKGSDAKDDFAVYRPLGATPVGDIPVAQHDNSPRVSLTVKAIKDDALSSPVGFSRRWTDAGSGADASVSFWEPRCNPGYVPMGHTAVLAIDDNYDIQPSLTDSTCVKVEYTEPGKWELIWSDKESGADEDVSVYKSNPIDSNGQGMAAMGTMPYKDDTVPDRPAFVLKSSIVQYVVGKPTTKYVLTNVQYLFDDRKTLSSNPEQLARTIVMNNGTTEQRATRSLSYTYSETRDWSVSLSLEIGVEMSVTAGVPEIGSATRTTSISFTTTYNTGESHTTSSTDRIDALVTVQPKSQKTVTVMSTRYIADVPYTATLKSVYADGTSEILQNYSGVYRGAEVAEVRVQMDADVPMS